MRRRTARIEFRGIVEHRHQADVLVIRAGEAALVRRGVDRSLTLACPDGCGEMLTINLDRRSGQAWRFYRDADSISVFPSVWRTTGCKSHFIVWRSRIYWCDWNEEFEPISEAFQQVVFATLTSAFQAYTSLADQLGAVPWAVLVACNQLTSQGRAQCGVGDEMHYFRLR